MRGVTTKATLDGRDGRYASDAVIGRNSRHRKGLQPSRRQSQTDNPRPSDAFPVVFPTIKALVVEQPVPFPAMMSVPALRDGRVVRGEPHTRDARPAVSSTMKCAHESRNRPANPVLERCRLVHTERFGDLQHDRSSGR